MASPFAGLTVSPEVKAALRSVLAEVVLQSNAWQARALAAEADAASLREGVLAQLQLERAPTGAAEALRAVAAACHPPQVDASFQRQVAIVQTVREFGGGGSLRAATTDVTAFLLGLLLDVDCSGEEEALPRHAAAFADAAVRLLAASGALEEGARRIVAALLTAEGAQAATLSCALARFASPPVATGAPRALLLAAAAGLRDACVACAEAARAAAGRPFLAAPTPGEEVAEAGGRAAVLLLPVIDASLCTLAGSAESEREAALETLASFAKLHAKSQRLVDPLRLRHGLLAAAVRSATAAANLVALDMLRRP